jgi:SAM-dependent methyltransferase
VLPGGHGGDAFRDFCDTQMEVFRVIADDSPAETYDAYQFHSWLFLLRQVSLPVPVWSDDDPMFQAMLGGVPDPTIIDFGCGLAQTSVSLALALKAKGVRPHIVLADIPSVRLEFITWLCRWVGLSCETRACTRDHPLTEFPAADIAVATEIFEHLHDPVPAFERLDAALRPGGFFVTNIDDHRDEFMHVSPDLGALRDRVDALGYAELDRYVLYRKRLTTAVSKSEAAA